MWLQHLHAAVINAEFLLLLEINRDLSLGELSPHHRFESMTDLPEQASNRLAFLSILEVTHGPALICDISPLLILPKIHRTNYDSTSSEYL
jgi:hypothetical protein